jgi:ATP adenylyltransferase
MFSSLRIEEMARRALASGALRPVVTRTIQIEDGGVRFVVRAVSSLERKEQAREPAAIRDPLGDYEDDLFVADLTATHYVLLNKFPAVAGHVLIVTRRFEPQERLLTVDDFEALAACLARVDGLGFYNGGVEAGASQPRKHLQLVPLPFVAGDGDRPPIEPLLVAGDGLPFRHAVAPIAPDATPAALHAIYRGLLARCAVAAVPSADGEMQSAPYNLLVRRRWMMVVPRSRARVESIAVNALGFAGSLFVRSDAELARVREIGPMQVLRSVALGT